MYSVYLVTLHNALFFFILSYHFPLVCSKGRRISSFLILKHHLHYRFARWLSQKSLLIDMNNFTEVHFDFSCC